MRRLLLLACLLVSVVTVSAQRQDNYKPTNNAKVALQATNLPIVFINVEGKMIQREDRITARMTIIDNPEGTNYADTLSHPSQHIDYQGYIGLKYRGNSSFDYSDKKPFGFKTLSQTLEAGGKKQKVSLLGMGADNDWALLAPFSDKSMMRDVLTMDLARPYFQYVPHMRHVELIVDGTYYGIYMLSERVGKGKYRLDLDDPGKYDGDLTGDYLVQVDRADESAYYTSRYKPVISANGATSWKSVHYQYKAPAPEDFADLPTGTRAAIDAAIDEMETCLKSDDYKDATRGYRALIDPTSWASYLLATELAGNVDGYRLSTNFYRYCAAHAKKKGTDTRWRMSLWDFNIAYGNANYNNGSRTDVWEYEFNLRNSGDDFLVPFYWPRLMADDSFRKEVAEQWRQWRGGQYATAHIMQRIDSIAAVLTDGGAMARNQEAWSTLGRYVWPNAYVGATYDAEVNYLKTWIKRRLAWMDQQLLGESMDPVRTAVGVASGWNADLVVEAPPASTHSTGGVDDHSCFYTMALRSSGSLANNGVVTAASGTKYQLASFTGNNALYMGKQGAQGALVFAEPFNTASLYMLATGAYGGAPLAVTLHYADGSSSEPQTVTVPDWVSGDYPHLEAVTGLGRIKQNGNEIDQSNHNLFEITLTADATKSVTGISFEQLESGMASVFAFAWEKASPTGISLPAAIVKQQASVAAVYSPSGQRQPAMQPGINIVRYADGTTRKIVVR